MPLPFEVSFDELRQRLDQYVDAVFDSLTSEFLVMPKGPGFVEFPVFDAGYEALKRATGNFAEVTVERILPAIYETPIAFVVLRCILGFTPPEWAWYTSNLHAGGGAATVSETAVRTIDRKVRLNPLVPLRPGNRGSDGHIRALIGAACQILQAGAPPVNEDRLHRLDKADTAHGLVSLRSFATLGAPYPVLLYERFLGRPFAGHRDSISELVGNVLENLVEDRLVEAGISFRKTRRAERLPGFDQAPDFVVPSEVNPRIVIEAKLTEDGGTARDKVTRVQHLSSLSLADRPGYEPKFELIACIAGRGFRLRREDMKKLLLATRGKVFTLDHLDRLVDATALSAWRTRPPAPNAGPPGRRGCSAAVGPDRAVRATEARQTPRQRAGRPRVRSAAYPNRRQPSSSARARQFESMEGRRGASTQSFSCAWDFQGCAAGVGRRVVAGGCADCPGQGDAPRRWGRPLSSQPDGPRVRPRARPCRYPPTACWRSAKVSRGLSRTPARPDKASGALSGTRHGQGPAQSRPQG